MKKLFATKIAFSAITAALVITSCNKSPYPGYELSENGVYAKFYTQTNTDLKAKEGDVVKLYMAYKNNKDSVLFDSKMNKNNGSEFIEFPLTKSSFKGSFEDALSMMSIGDSASFIISADSVYMKTFGAKEVPPYIEKGSMLNFVVKLIKITAKADAEKERNEIMKEQKALAEIRSNEETKIFADYIASNKITAKPTQSGLYYIEKTKGNGSKPPIGSTVKVNYTGRLINGEIFDTSIEATAKQANLYDKRRPYEPIEFPLGTGKVIKGWDEGISLMSVGSKGQLIIPSNMAYGEQGAGEFIPPFSSLIFDVELVSFQ